MELILKAWTEPQPFGWQGRYFQYRTVSVWPRPLQQPYPPTYALGISRESCELAARNRLGLGLSYGPFEVMAKSTRYYREQAAQYGWEPGPDDIIYRANMVLGETDEEAEKIYQERAGIAPFPVRAGLRAALLEADRRNVAGEARPANVGGVLPTTFVGGPDTVVKQIRRCREEIGAGVLDLSLHPPGSGDVDALMSAIELFGKKVLPRIREI
jgi:alkanesulfonate monooxygenase SsuD/methylene tetrahydromethanopterin reductase-like flavin-dependent oxidoreductase (luciferase family)